MAISRGITSTWFVCALLFIASFRSTNKATVSALIAGEPTSLLFDRTWSSPEPPADPDSYDDDDEEIIDPYAGCFSNVSDSGSTSTSPSACPFIFKKPHRAFRTDGGEFKVVNLGEDHLLQRRKVAIGLLTLEANTLLLPQYVNGPSVFYVHRGKGHLSYVHGKRRSKMLVSSEVFAISAGTPFYILNPQSNEILQLVLLVDLSDTPGKHASLECFYVAGGLYPTTVMSGFSEKVLAAAFKVALEEIENLFSLQDEGPIVNATKLQTEVLASVPYELEDEYADGATSIFNKKKKERHYRLLDEKHMFRNENGWSASMSRKRYRGLEEADVGMLAVGVKSGCMVAPFWNPRMTEIGIVTHGRGSIQVVAPNGTTLVDMDLEAGSVFVVPRYHPSSKLATNDSEFEYVGFTTSSDPMEPYFLAGTNTMFNFMDTDVLSMAFNITKYSLQRILGTQPDKIILTKEESNW